MRRLGWLASDHLAMILGVVGLVAVVGYYLVAWWRVGRDPARGTVIPLFEPPDGLSPAGMRFVLRQKFDGRCFTAAVLSLAVKKRLRIVETGRSYRLDSLGGDGPALSPGERALLAAIGPSLELEQKNHSAVRRARDALRRTLEADYEGAFFRRNRGWFVAGAALSALAALAVFMALADSGFADTAFITVWLGIWWFVVGSFGFKAVQKWRVARGLGYLGALGQTLLLVPFVIAGLVAPALLVLAREAFTLSVAVFGFAALLVLVNLLFFHLLKAPTVAGRQLMDRIEGFHRYLSVAEEPRLDILHPPDRTPELFERYLPYAVAFDCEHAWSMRFAGVLAAAGMAAPAWYSGSHWDSSNPGRFAGDLSGGLSSATAAASTAPGSSSGSGGGGSSGGGGGGGGGSGW
jgi:uncharacterized membrane protein YgcG